MSTDRPTPRSRVKATPAVDEAASATPITPAAPPTAARTPPATPTARTNAFAQLNVRITLDVQDDLEYLMALQGLNKVNAVSDSIRQRAAHFRAADRTADRPGSA